MCGIFALLNNDTVIQQLIESSFNKGRGRGPENSVLTHEFIKLQIGFHRLAINGLNDESNQPIHVNNVSLICNGEIYNYKELYKTMNVKPTTDSDCEVIIHLYKKYGIEQTLSMLDGVFSFILVEKQYGDNPTKMYVARDPYGVRPLYRMRPISSGKPSKHYMYGFASELKGLYDIYKEVKDTNRNKRTFDNKICKYPDYIIEQFSPGTYSQYDFCNNHYWKHKVSQKYHHHGFHSNILNPQINTEDVFRNIRIHLTSAVEKRCITTERPVACLLSGGLDSSLITALVNEYCCKNDMSTLETYSIGLEGAEDLKYARIVADYLGTKHTEVIVTEKEFIDAIPEVIYGIESYDTTTVRASIGNWLLGKYISKHSEAKVIFNGDGSDELSGGYLYMGKAPDEIEFDRECRRLLKYIHTFDVLRSDKSISSHGLEPRTPFLDRTWTEYYLSIPTSIRFHTNNNQCEKYLIRKAFSSEEYKNHNNERLLPDDVLWRRKEAFSDGVSKHTRSLYEIIQEYADTELENTSNIDTLTHLPPETNEQRYYRSIFEKHYDGLGQIIPHFWMPKYVNATDSSARTLSIYK